MCLVIKMPAERVQVPTRRSLPHPWSRLSPPRLTRMDLYRCQVRGRGGRGWGCDRRFCSGRLGGQRALLRISIANPAAPLSNQLKNQCCGSGTRNPVPLRPWIRDLGWGKNPDLGSGMNIPDHFSESSETIFWVKNTLILWYGSGSRIFWPWIRDPGWEIRILNPVTSRIPNTVKTYTSWFEWISGQWRNFQ